MANQYWIETQKYAWPAALARLMLMLAAAFLIVLIAGYRSAPSMGPDVRDEGWHFPLLFGLLGCCRLLRGRRDPFLTPLCLRSV